MATQNLLTIDFMIEYKSSPTSSQPLAVLNITYDADATATLSSSAHQYWTRFQASEITYIRIIFFFLIEKDPLKILNKSIQTEKWNCICSGLSISWWKKFACTHLVLVLSLPLLTYLLNANGL